MKCIPLELQQYYNVASQAFSRPCISLPLLGSLATISERAGYTLSISFAISKRSGAALRHYRVAAMALALGYLSSTRGRRGLAAARRGPEADPRFLGMRP